MRWINDNLLAIVFVTVIALLFLFAPAEVKLLLVGLCGATAAVSFFLLRSRKVSLIRKDEGRCRRCGYDLSDSVSRCPECGDPMLYYAVLCRDTAHSVEEATAALTASTGVDAATSLHAAREASQRGFGAVMMGSHGDAVACCQKMCDAGYAMLLHAPSAKHQHFTPPGLTAYSAPIPRAALDAAVALTTQARA